MKARIPSAGPFLLWLIQGAVVDGFLPPRTTTTSIRCGPQTPTGTTTVHPATVAIHTSQTTRTTPLASAVPENGAEDSSSSCKSSENVVDVVLFGLGDLRVDDHIGLINALSGADTDTPSKNDDDSSLGVVIPLCVLTPEALSNFPGSVAHTGDTARLIAAALAGVDAGLQYLVGGGGGGGGEERTLNVACWTGGDDDDDDPSFLETVLLQVQHQFGAERLRVHACDLGDADNAMEYGAYSQIRHLARNSQLPVEVIPWNNDLRVEPWKHVSELSDQFPDYDTVYGQTPVTLPRSIQECITPTAARRLVTLDGLTLPTGDELERCMSKVLDLDAPRCASERNTGLYATHWGGLDPSSVAEAAVLDVVRAYATDCRESDKAWFEHPLYVGRHVKRNGLSLEHAAMQWQLRGDGTFPTGNPDNWLPGESLVRFLSAPLLLGTISPRRLWHASTTDGFLFRSPLKQLVEGREWHRLLAARNMRSDPAYQGQGETIYEYWRYQGFLVRCAMTQFSPATGAASSQHREGVLLIHGFGASGTQWNKAMQELRQESGEGGGTCQGLAPDLLGFGHSEKPALSYTAYLWDSQTGDFVKEVALRQNGWTSFVVGGNSIGGYTSMSAAASDTAQVGHRQLTSSGAPGTGRCTGLVLMNSAGPLPNRDEVAAQMSSTVDKKLDLRRQTVAQVTALDGLPPCRPPPRPVARAFGALLLSYLRPRIQSICRNLYPTDPSAVDGALCGSILRDSLDPGAVYVMMAGAKLPAPRTANELLSAAFGGVPTTAPTEGGEGSAPPPGSPSESVFAGPVLVAQGVLDPLNDAQDRLERFAALRNGVTADPIAAGHCPHDELPMEVAGSIARWMSATRSERWTSVVSSSSSLSPTSSTTAAAAAR